MARHPRRPKLERQGFARRVRELRSRKRLTQEELAKEVGVKGQQVYRWEAGGPEPGADILESLAAVLQTTPEYLRHGGSRGVRGGGSGHVDAMALLSILSDRLVRLESRVDALDGSRRGRDSQPPHN